MYVSANLRNYGVQIKKKLYIRKLTRRAAAKLVKLRLNGSKSKKREVIYHTSYISNFFYLYYIIFLNQSKGISKLVCSWIGIFEKILVDPPNLKFSI